MKKAILILLVGLFWCNVGFAETEEQTIINEHKSSLPECEGGEADIVKDLSRWSEWDKCFGILKIEVENEETIFHVEFKNGEMHGKGFAEIGDTIMYGKFKNGGLCYFSDKEKDKQNIITNSRLTEIYFDYQALCTEINAITINTISELFNIPIINFSKVFKNMGSNERLKYFFDEIHYNHEGNHLCAEEFNKQIKYLNFEEIKKKVKKSLILIN